MKQAGIILILINLVLIGCKSNVKEQYHEIYPDIYPDYLNICIPYNIAPLNFKVDKKVKKVSVVIACGKDKLSAHGTFKITFPIKEFKSFLNRHKGDTAYISVIACFDTIQIKYKTFWWYIVDEPIDNYLTYRLIEPAYEIWNKISINQRNISNFDERVLVDNNVINGSCINCHIGSKQNPGKSFFHVRGKNGGTIIVDEEKLRRINTKPQGAYSNAIYGNWHPSGRFIAFSTNVVVPALHSVNNKRLMVYDSKSDIIVIDLETSQIISSPLIQRSDKFETFPEFSSDGEKMFFCVADSVSLPKDHKSLHYSLCSIDFDPSQRRFGEKIDTLINSKAFSKTVSEPKASPDGKYLLFSFFDYGTFPIWHPETKIFSYNLLSGKIDSMPELNNNKKYSNSYHCWSSGSNWIVFASKRDNGMYGKPYFSYIDKNGKSHKPFLLPQKDPEYYDFMYKSYNIPELFETPRKFNSFDIERILDDSLSLKTVSYFIE